MRYLSVFCQVMKTRAAVWKLIGYRNRGKKDNPLLSAGSVHTLSCSIIICFISLKWWQESLLKELTLLQIQSVCLVKLKSVSKWCFLRQFKVCKTHTYTPGHWPPVWCFQLFTEFLNTQLLISLSTKKQSTPETPRYLSRSTNRTRYR